MLIEGLCRTCHQPFNNLYMEINMLDPKCVVCKSEDVSVWSDEEPVFESNDGDDYDE